MSLQAALPRAVLRHYPMQKIHAGPGKVLAFSLTFATLEQQSDDMTNFSRSVRQQKDTLSRLQHLTFSTHC